MCLRICTHVCVCPICTYRQSRASVRARGGSRHITEPQPEPPAASSGGGGNPQTSAAQVLNVQDRVTDSEAYLRAASRLGSTYNANAMTVATAAVAERFAAAAPQGQRKLWCLTTHREFQKETERSIWQPHPPFPPPHAPVCWGFKGGDGGRSTKHRGCRARASPFLVPRTPRKDGHATTAHAAPRSNDPARSEQRIASNRPPPRPRARSPRQRCRGGQRENHHPRVRIRPGTKAAKELTGLAPQR